MPGLFHAVATAVASVGYFRAGEYSILNDGYSDQLVDN